MADVRTAVGMVRINDGEPVAAQLEMTRETQVVRSRLPRKDPSWSSTDAAGHFHAYDDSGATPTLRAETVPMPCDGSCGGVCGGEGYTATRWTCRICGEETTPGVREGEHSTVIETGRFWRIVAEVPWAGANDEVTVRFTHEGAAEERFGVARRSAGEVVMHSGGVRGRVTLHGVAELGRRALSKVSA